MITRPAVHEPASTMTELRAFFQDDHVHMALIVEAGRLIGVVERADLQPALSGSTPAQAIATLDGRTIRPDAALAEAFAVMSRGRRRRLAVTTDDSTLLGLLCLKASGLGFCSADDVRNRRHATAAPTSAADVDGA